jgi:hypothetical protein
MLSFALYFEVLVQLENNGIVIRELVPAHW